MQERSWTLGDENVDELYEYNNLGVYKNYCGSFNANIDENIEKIRKKARIIFSANINRHKTSPLIYVKYWKQVCLPSLLLGSEIFSLTSTKYDLIANCGLNGGVPWLCGTNGALCFFCKDEAEDCSHFSFKANFSPLWQNLNSKILLMNPTDFSLHIHL